MFISDNPVTTFAVVWIEIVFVMCYSFLRYVTTFAVVWIEICKNQGIDDLNVGHHLRGGVD